MDDQTRKPNGDEPFFLDENSDVSKDDSGNFSQDDDVRDGARPILRLRQLGAADEQAEPESGADASSAETDRAE